ncbi:MAG TPA: TonB-dependent receptor, partial [Longimicrobiales bacterium]
MKRYALAAVAALVACLPVAARAQEPRDTVLLKELVVTATRTPTPRAALPLATSVITGAELQERGLRTVAEALRTLPGVALASTGSYGALTSLFLRGGNSGYVKVLVDGVSANDPGGSYDFSHLSTADVERIEVVRGPASVLYGTDAVSGVIQVFTRRGSGKPRVHASASGGSGERIAGPSAAGAGHYGIGDVAADASGGGKLAGWSLGASRFESGGLYPQDNGYLNTTLAGRLELRPASGSNAAITLRRTGGYFHFPTDGAGNVVDANSATRTDAWTLGLEGGHRFGALDARVLLGSNETNRADLDPQDSPADTSGVFASEGHTLDRRRSADLHLDWHLSGYGVVTAGAAVERESESAHSWYRSSFGNGNDSTDVARTNRGVYAQALAAPARGITLTGGARLDDNSRFGRFGTWRAGAAWRVLASTRLRLAAGTAFKEPTFYQNYAQGFVMGNPGLKPERSSSWEAGAEQALLAGRVSLQATWFDQRFRDLIQYLATPPKPGQPNYFN